MKMKRGALYKVKTTIPVRWRYYIFLSDSEMIIFDEDLKDYEYRDDLQQHLIDKEDFVEINVNTAVNLNKEAKRLVIKGIL